MSFPEEVVSNDEYHTGGIDLFIFKFLQTPLMEMLFDKDYFNQKLLSILLKSLSKVFFTKYYSQLNNSLFGTVF